MTTMCSKEIGKSPSVLLCALTGRATFNIFGQTIHLHVDQCGHELQELSADVANTMRTHLAELQVVVIDGISRVSEEDLHFIDQHLRQFLA